MRVTIADPSAFTPPYDHALCAALGRAGADVELVTSKFVYGTIQPPEGYRRTELFYGLTTRACAGRPLSRMRLCWKLAEHPVDMGRFLKLLRHEKPDLVHFQWFAVQPVDLCFIKRIKQPIVLTAHDVLPREPKPGQIWATRKLYKAVDAVVVHSEHGRRRITGELGIDPAKVHVIPHGAFDYLTAQPRQQIDLEVGHLGERRVVLFFGLLRPYKGVDLLIEAFASVPGDALLLIVGMPRMPIQPLTEMVKRLGLADRVRFLPRFISDAEIRAYFERADLVVLPYREIDQSGVLYTALAFGKPIVVTRVGGFTEVAERDGAARAVPPNDPEALARVITELVEDDEARHKLAQAAAAAAAGPYSWDAIATQTLALYESLIA